MKTWHIETAVVALILITVNLITGKLFTKEILAVGAIILTFGYVSISSRLAEDQENRQSKPTVECYNKLIYYYISKESLWFAYFLVIGIQTGNYSPLVGVVVFLIHPLWRKWYRKRYPKNR